MPSPPENLPKRGNEQIAAQRRAAAEIRIGWKMAAIGMEVAAQVAGGALLGWAVDAIFGTSWGVLIGAVVGLAVGMWSLIKGSLKLNKQLEAMGPHSRKLGLPPKQASKDTPNEDDLPSWREEWDDWKEGDDGDGVERDN